MAERERAVAETFVDLADTLAHDYEVSEFLEMLLRRCTDVLEVTTGGVMLESATGHLQIAAALTADMEALEQAEIDNEDGPCHQAYRTGTPVTADDLDHSDAAEQWPTVVERMRDLGLKAVYAFPIRLRDDCIGALNLYRDTPGAFDDEDIRLGQAFADAAAIGILQERKVASVQERAAQLQHALDSRLVIEQAKGIISAQRQISLDAAFHALRHHARSNQRKIHDVARAVIDRGASAIRGS